MNDVGIGVIGLGRLGRMHAFNAAWRTPRARLTAVCDAIEDLARATAAEMHCTWYTDFHRMLEDPAVDAVVVVTPTALHVEPVEAAAQAGKPILCEKPLGHTLEATRHLVDVVKRAGVACSIGFNRRYDPAFVEAERLIRDGGIGKPVFFNAFNRDVFPPPPWACNPNTGGGLFVDFLLHEFDLARFLVGDEVESVMADETNLVVDPQGIERFADNATASLRFRGGQLGACHASMHASYSYDSRVEVYGSAGSIQVGGLNRTEVTLCTPERGICRPDAFLPREGRVPFLVRFWESYEVEMAEFACCVMNGAPPKANEDDALAAYKISLAASKAASDKCRVAIE